MSAPDKQNDALILAQSCALLSRSLAYVRLADLSCGRALSVEIRNHLDEIHSYALAKGIAREFAIAMLDLMAISQAEVSECPTA